MTTREIETSRPAGISSMGPDVRQVIPAAIVDIDPFVFLDHYGPFEKQPGWAGVPGHPHAGISTITYLVSGTNRHQDSLGNDVVGHAGDMAWMRAGRGIVHAEGNFTDAQAPETSHGLQFWISLPAKDKFIEPDFVNYTSAQLPVFTHNKVAIKVLCGELFNHISPARSESPVYIFDMLIPANEVITLPVASGDTCGLYVIDGVVESDNQSLASLTITRFERSGDNVVIKAIKNCHIVLFGGTPLDEPIVSHASFVLNSQEQIKQVVSDYHSGKMGKITEN